MAKKSNTTELLLLAALLGGAVYFVFFTERGRQWSARMMEAATNKLDDLLASLEMELADAESEAREADE